MYLEPGDGILPAAVFEGDVVVTGRVRELDARPRAYSYKHSNSSGENRTDPVPWMTYRDRYIGDSGFCGPYLVGLNDKGLYVSASNITKSNFLENRAVCCVYPRRAQCSGWEAFTASTGAGGDVAVMRERQAAIYEKAATYESARLDMDLSSYYLPPSRSLVLTGRALTVWNTHTGAVWLSRCIITVPTVRLSPGSDSQEPVFVASVSTVSRTFNISISPDTRGVLDDTGTFLYNGTLYGVVPEVHGMTHLPVLAEPDEPEDCQSAVTSAQECLSSTTKHAVCVQEMYRARARACCNSLARARIFIHCG